MHNLGLPLPREELEVLFFTLKWEDFQVNARLHAPSSERNTETEVGVNFLIMPHDFFSRAGS